MNVGELLGRPLRAATWREALHLLLGFVMSVVVFIVLVTLLSLGLGLLVTLVGLPILLATAYVNRGRAFQDLGEVDRAMADFAQAKKLGR